MLWWILMALGRAQEPTVSVEADGTVVAVVELAATPERVRGVLDDPYALAKLSPDILSTKDEPGAPAGCQRLARETKGMWRPLKLVLQRCRTETGWREELVSSEDFTAYATDWTLTATATGTKVVYRVKTAVNLPVPRSMMDAAVKDKTTQTVKNLAKTVTGG